MDKEKEQLEQFAAGVLAINSLSKDALIELHREAYGNVGDTARTSKSDYIERLNVAPVNISECATRAANRIASTEPKQPTYAPRAMPLDVFEPASTKTAPLPAPAKAAPVVSQSAADQLTALIASIAAANQPKQDANIDAEAVRAIIREEVGSLKPLQINIHGKAAVTLPAEHRHPAFEDVLTLAAAGLNVLLVGPAGTGKTFLAEQVSRALGRNYGALHCTAGASESQLMGWLLPTGEHGRFEYAAAPFVSLYEGGNSLFLLDEIDAADPNMLLCINGALANGHLHIPQRLGNPCAHRGEDVAIIAAANTFGTGADFVYSGRNQLDAATLDRFATVFIDYDRELERAMLPDGDLLGWLWSVRETVANLKLRRVISTRAAQKAAALVAAGWPTDKIKKTILAGWTRDELNRAGI